MLKGRVPNIFYFIDVYSSIRCATNSLIFFVKFTYDNAMDNDYGLL